LWDVEGIGMQPIKDKDVALALRAKVTDFNLRGVAVPAVVTTAFVALPWLFGWP